MRMDRANFLRRLLALFVIAGLYGAPLAAPAQVGAPVDEAAMGMSENTPCCPKAPMLPECQKCPAMALCAANCVLSAPIAATAVHWLPKLTRLSPALNDRPEAGLDQPPPARPPRTWVNPA